VGVSSTRQQLQQWCVAANAATCHNQTHVLQQFRKGSTAETIANFIEKASRIYEQKRRAVSPHRAGAFVIGLPAVLLEAQSGGFHADRAAERYPLRVR
jgi:hypothetical protein